MNLQIFGKAKCFDTKKAQRYCKERRLKFQNVDILSKGLSRRELLGVLQCVGYDAIVDPGHPDAKWFQSLIFDQQKLQALLDDPSLFRTPIVRNGAKATVGYCPEVWRQWEEAEGT